MSRTDPKYIEVTGEIVEVAMPEWLAAEKGLI